VMNGGLVSSGIILRGVPDGFLCDLVVLMSGGG
jgi:hypothetical protein